MKISRSLPLCALASAFLCSIPALAQQAAPAVRILNPINESQRVTLTHTVSPLANAANDRGAAPDGMLLDRIQLVLQRSPAQEAALHQLLAGQNTPGSPSYHQWLTPQQFGAEFGPSDQDIAAIESWLGSHGFTVSRVNPGKGTLEFSGSVGQLRDTFHTQIHQYSVNGENHFANANDPQIPAAIAPVIAGFTSLNNFRPHPYLQKLGEASFNPTTHQVTPSWTQGTGNGGVFFVMAPADYAVQYDLAPLYAAGTNGSGQTIAIINDSNVNIDLVNQFRTLFNLPVNPPQVVIDGNDPGVDGINNPDGPNFNSQEAYLDVEWAGAVAPNAQVDLVIAADTSIEQGLVLAMEHAVYANIAPVISISFGACEKNLGAENSFINGLWEQAAAQGQTVTVSTGDNGSAACDNDNVSSYAVGGQAVNGFASTPFNVAVGGTDFFYSDYADNGTTNQSIFNAQLATYWSTTATQLPTASGSLLQVVPEQPWNNSQYGLNAYNQLTASGGTSSTIAAASGGASNAAICSTNTYGSTGCTGTLTGYPKPAWQTGTGATNDTVRDLPDVSLFAANGSNYSFYPICASDADCQTAGLGTNGLVQIFGVGGTSASSPAFAAIMALVNQKYGRQGQADNVLYALKTQFPAAFHDVTHGTVSVPCEILPTATPNCISVTSPAVVNGVTEGQIGTGTTPEYNAAAGYNLATGLGTVDANVLVADWNKVSLATSTTTFACQSPCAPGATFAHGTAINISGTVTGTTPAGNVALMTDSTEPLEQGQNVFPLSSGAYSGSAIKTLPGGTYHIWAQYGGDSKNAMSTSTPPIQITVTPETPGMNFNLFNAALGEYFTSSSNPGTSVDFGTQLVLSAEVAPTSQLPALQTCVINGTGCSGLIYTQPTGTVTFKDGSTPLNTAVMNAEGDAEYNAPWSVGAHSVTAAYNGDQSYNAFTSPAIAFTVVKDSPVMGTVASNETSSGQIIATQPTVFNVIVENGVQYNTSTSINGAAIAPVPVAPPTGTVTVSSSPSGITGTVTLSSSVDPSTGAQAGIGTLTIPASTLTASSYVVSLVYSGDSNYLGNSGSPVQQSFSVVTGGVASTTTATMTGAISPNSNILITGSVSGKSGDAAPTGSVFFFSSGNSLGGVNLPSCTLSPSSCPNSYTVNFSAVLSSQSLFQGANFVTLQYTGDSTYSPSETTLNNGNPIANPLADFTLIPNTTIVPVSISGGASSGTDTINVASVNGFAGTVNLTCKATSPLTCSYNTSNPAISNGTSAAPTLTINVPSGTANGNYNVLVNGVDANTGEFVHTLAITADVTGTSTTTPGFALSNSGNITVTQGATTGNTSTITVTPANGFTGAVNLACSVTTTPPTPTSPVTCSIPASITLPGTTTATLTANSTATTTAGAYAITVTGTSGSISSPTVVNVTVNSTTPAASYSVAATGPSSTASKGVSTTASLKVTGTGSYTGSVTLTCALNSGGPTNQSGDAPTCSVTSGSPVALSSGTTSGTATATITSVAATADLIVPKFGNGKGWLGAGSGAVLAFVLFFGIPARRRTWRSMLGIAIAMIALGALSSCGGGGNGGGGGGGGGNPGTASGTYTFTVSSSTTGPAVNPSPSATFTVTY